MGINHLSANFQDMLLGKRPCGNAKVSTVSRLGEKTVDRPDQCDKTGDTCLREAKKPCPTHGN